jgi:hypothetical protein
VDIPGSGLLRGAYVDQRTGQWVFPDNGRGGRHSTAAATQTGRRFDMVDLDPFDYSTPAGITAFLNHLAGVEDQLRLLRSFEGMLTSGEMPEYLFGRTRGVVGLLRRLFEDGCTEAILTGEERLTPELLAKTTIHLGNLDDLDPGASEVPTSRRTPPRPRRPSPAAGADATRSSTTAGTGRPRVTDMAMSSGRRPFGLSLDPLKGESLTGFVLRLAHRLHISPHELARQTGLTEQDRIGRARASLSTRLTPAEIKNFAAATRLDPREVRAMTLEPLASRYPPAARSVANVRAGKVYSMHTDGWLFAATARYCPRCLAGDGSDIQNAHGGPWQILWRLPVVFACPLREVFLEHLCPHCRKPVNFSSRAQLFPRPAASGVHPAHCRSSTDQHIPTTRPGSPCGARLAHDPLHHHRPGPALLALQHKILRLLRPGGPKQPAQQYFTELILLAGLVTICWPRPSGRHHPPTRRSSRPTPRHP